MFSRWLAALPTLPPPLSLFQHRASSSAAAANKLETIQSNGKLVIALEGAWQPWSFHDESDTLVGYDVEVSRAIAEKLGVEPEYVESDWDSLFAGLDAGRYDLVCNGVEVTEERAKTYDFTTPYGLHPHRPRRPQG